MVTLIQAYNNLKINKKLKGCMNKTTTEHKNMPRVRIELTTLRL